MFLNKKSCILQGGYSKRGGGRFFQTEDLFYRGWTYSLFYDIGRRIMTILQFVLDGYKKFYVNFLIQEAS